MKELKGVFQPEISPIHKREFSVACELTLEGANLQKAVIPAGTLLKSGTASTRIEEDPTKGCKVAVVGDVAQPLGVLMHDVVVDPEQTKYSVGVLIKGVVYKDVMENANTKANFTSAVIEALAPRILTYGVITLGK